MRQKLDSSKNFLWQENFHTNVVVISSKELDKYFGKRKLRWDKYYKHHEGVLSSISIPLFTQDMTECVVYIAHSCGGPCGGGCVYIFKNVNGRWIRIDQFNCWIS